MRHFLKACLFAALLMGCFRAEGKVTIAFLQLVDPQTGEVVALEKGGRFGHVAIAYKGGWIHSYPGRPVERVENLKPYGQVIETITLEGVPPLSDEAVEAQLGKPFDMKFRWDDPNSTYCAKLVAQLMGIEPRPMYFDSDFWENFPSKPQQGIGISPDDIHEVITENSRCMMIL